MWMGLSQSQLICLWLPPLKKHWDQDNKEYINFICFIVTMVMKQYPCDNEHVNLMFYYNGNETCSYEIMPWCITKQFLKLQCRFFCMETLQNSLLLRSNRATREGWYFDIFVSYSNSESDVCSLWCIFNIIPVFYIWWIYFFTLKIDSEQGTSCSWKK
jgi:hypothetical protein